jgi:hypothetical protein
MELRGCLKSLIYYLNGRLEVAATQTRHEVAYRREGCLRRLKTLGFVLVHEGGLRLCSSVSVSVPEALLYSPKTFQTTS